MPDNKFIELSEINVNKYTEKKGNLTYLSWAWAVDQLMRHDPAANWVYGEPVRWNETVMVFCTVTAFGKSMTCQLPVMDHRNKAIPNPDAFAVNTAMQRCLVKAIALHGLGLYIYAGEDLPESGKITPTAGAWESIEDDERIYLEGIASEVNALLANNDVALACTLIESKNLDADEKVALWTRFDSKQRAAMKKHQSAPEPFNYEAALDSMADAVSEAQLKAIFAPAWQRAKTDGNKEMMDTVKANYDTFKAKFAEPEPAAKRPTI